MSENIIKEAQKFVGQLRKDLKKVDDDNLFIINLKGRGKTVTCVSVATYTDMKVGSLARKVQPELYDAADKLYAMVKSAYNGVSGVSILLTDEYETDVFQDGKLLRICNLDA